ncbi:unnamed protein product [Closterium sp. NIES-65]|nr:unnamed protein product [Closterium sp. NIES-65]
MLQGNSGKLPVTGEGDVVLQSPYGEMRLENVLLVEDLKVNLVSQSQLDDLGCKIFYDRGEVAVFGPEWEKYADGYSSDSFYEMNLVAMNDKDEIYEDPESTEDDESEDSDDMAASVEAAVKQEEEIVIMEAAARLTILSSPSLRPVLPALPPTVSANLRHPDPSTRPLPPPPVRHAGRAQVEGRVVAEICVGLCVLVGVMAGDGEHDCDYIQEGRRVTVFVATDNEELRPTFVGRLQRMGGAQVYWSAAAIRHTSKAGVDGQAGQGAAWVGGLVVAVTSRLLLCCAAGGTC